jgi:hypothetical protein
MALLAVAGCSSGGEAREADAEVTVASGAGGGTPITGGSPAQRALLREVVSGFGPTRSRRFALAPLAGHWNVPTPGAVSLTAYGKGSRPEWESWVLTGAFNVRARERGVPPIAVAGSGDVASNAGGVGTGPPRATAGGAAQLATRIERAADRFDVEIVRATVHRPYGLAASVVVRPDDPAAFLRHRVLAFTAAIGDRFESLDGLYLLVLDTRNSRVLLSMNGSRLSIGGVAVRPDLEACSPFLHRSSTSAPAPPPCPAD